MVERGDLHRTETAIASGPHATEPRTDMWSGAPCVGLQAGAAGQAVGQAVRPCEQLVDVVEEL